MALRRAIVIGTGAGGLAAAAHLAKAGIEVTALEQAGDLGGYLAPIHVDGYTFDLGGQYVGEARPGQLLDRLIGDLGLDVQKLFVEMDPEGFELYRFPEFEIRMCRGLAVYGDRLVERFPEDQDGLRKLLRFAHIADLVPLVMRSDRLHASELKALRYLPAVLPWLHSTFAELLGHTLQNPRARAVVAAMGGDIGLPPSRLPALVGLDLIGHYADGAFYARGGNGRLRDALVQSGERYGARFRTAASVAEILVHDRAVTGVRLANGERLDTDVVISDVDPTITLGRMVRPTELPSKLLAKVERTVPSLPTFMILLGMRRDLRTHGLGAFNVCDYPAWDIESLYAPVFAGKLPKQLGFFLSSSTLRDDSGTLAPPGSSTLQIITFMPYELFARWADVPPNERGDDYRALRERLAEQLLGEVERRWPGLVGDIVAQRVETPLSNTDYTRAVRGAAYGPALTLAQFGLKRFGTRTPIRGLYLAGAGVFAPGVVYCLASGRLAAEVALGRRRMNPMNRPSWVSYMAA
jgi:all-trans-retinol 13,14-reductase